MKLHLLVPILLTVLTPFVTFSEGTKQLRPTAGDFGYINLMDQQNNLGTERTFALYNATDETRLNIRIKNPAEEKIYFGIQTRTTDDLYFRIKDPNGNIIVSETLVPQADGQPGKILNYNEAVAGPVVVDPGGYLPIEINPVPSLAGDYSIEFRDPNHNPPGNYAKRIIDLFDISVVNTTTSKAINGRLWSKAWDITTSSATNPFNGSAYIYTNDGITTKANFQQFEAWSFIIQSNNSGPSNTGVVMEDRKSIDGGRLLPDYKIFLTEPDTTEFPVSEVPKITGTPNIDLCKPGTGYCIDISLSNPGVVEYIIDIDGAVGFDHARDVMLSENVPSGPSCLPWDGLDGNGNPLTANDTFNIILSYQAGVTHLFIHDAENNPQGFNVEHVYPNTGLGDPLLFYDDSDPAVNGATNLTGCAADCHSWTGNFGNNKTLNTWWVTFFENDTIKDIYLKNPVSKAEVDISLDQVVNCLGDSLRLSPTNLVNEGASPTFSWSLNNTPLGDFNTFENTTVSDGDTVWLYLTPAELCIEADTAYYVVDLPTISTTVKDIELCEQSSDTLRASVQSSIPSTITYNWLPAGEVLSTQDSFAVVNPSATSLFTLAVALSDGCRDTTTATVTVNPKPNVTLTDVEICATDTSTLSAVVTNATGVVQYTWSPATEIISSTNNTAEVAPTSTSTYQVIVEDSKACKDTTNATITVNPKPSITLTDQEMCEGDSAILQATVSNFSGTVQYTWSPATDLDNTTTNKVIAKPTTTSNYLLLVEDSKACKDSVEITVTVNPKPTVTVNSGEICIGEKLSLTAVPSNFTGTVKYTWSPTSGLNTSNTAGVEASPATSTTYQVIIEDDNACKDTASATVTVHPKPSVSLTSGEICSGDSVELQSTVSGGTGTIDYFWSDENSTYTSTLDNIKVSPASSTQYQLLIEDANSCKDSATTNVTVNSSPEASIDGEDICSGVPAVLKVEVINSTGFVSYSWENTPGLSSYNSAYVTATPTSSTTYKVYVEDSKACRDSAEFTVGVTQNPTASILENDTILCLSESYDLTAFNNPSENYSFQWYYGKNSGSLSPISATSLQLQNVSDAGYYAVEVRNNGFCPVLSSEVLIELEEVQVQANASSTTILSDETVDLYGTGTSNIQTWKWITPNGEVFGQNITDLPSEDVVYTLIATGQKCTAEDTVAVKVLPPIIIPNGFRPNGDNKNDAWFIKGLSAYSNAEVVIYNRWGGKVYHYYSGYTVPWNGTNQNGNELPDATYYYVINTNGPNNATFHGTVTIIR